MIRVLVVDDDFMAASVHRSFVERIAGFDVVGEATTGEDALRLVATLPADQAELVALRVIAGLDVAAVASITGRSAGSVRVAVHRALKTLSTRIAAASTQPSQVEVP